MQLLVCIRVKLHQIYHVIPPDKYGAHASAFIEPVHSIVIRIKPPAWYAIDRNADRLQKNTVGGSGRHLRDQRYAGEIFRDQLIGRTDYFGIERRRQRYRTDRGHHRDFDTGIADRCHKCRLRPLHGFTGEDTAIYIGRSALR